MAKKRNSSRGKLSGKSARTPSSSSRALAQSDLDARFLLIASLVAALAFVLIPDVRHVRGASDAIPAMIAFRCVAAGCTAGLLYPRASPWWLPAAVTTVGVALGTGVVSLATSVGLHAGALVFGLALGCGVALGLSRLLVANMNVLAEVLAVALIVGILLSCAGFLPGVVSPTYRQHRQMGLASPPVPEHYSFDGAAFLRTYDLMEQGWGYYPAFRQGIIDDARHDASYITSPFNYREPFVFYLWRVLPGDTGAAVWDWFVVFAVIVLVCSYVLASSLVSRGAALLAPIALVGWFFYFFWENSWFATTEVWAAGFAVAAVMCLTRRWRVASLILLTAAVAAREFMVLLIPAWLLFWWFSGNRKASWWFAAGAVLGPALVLGAHLIAVPATSGGAGALRAWLNGSPSRFVAALGFGYYAMPLGSWISLAAAAAAIASAALARPRWKMSALLAATVLPTIFLLAFSQGDFHYYWGGFYVPLAISLAPGALGRVLPPQGMPELDVDALVR